MTTKRSDKDPVKYVKIMGKELPIEQLRINLAKVAKSRGLTGARLELRFNINEEPYYNIYKYAFFGKVPDIEIDPIARPVEGRTRKSVFFRKK